MPIRRSSGNELNSWPIQTRFLPAKDAESAKGFQDANFSLLTSRSPRP
jgi:hypothetical protein